jgi:uncharacterized protein (TIGR03437 family)
MIVFAEEIQMDAAKKFYKNTGILLFIALALVLAAPAWAQPALQLNSNIINLNQSTLSGGVNVTSSGAAITFTANITGLTANGGNGQWLRFPLGTSNQFTTPSSVVVEIGNFAGMVAGTYSATITLTPSAPAGVAPATISVTWLNGSGGGGGGGGGNTISLSSTNVGLSAAPGAITFGNVTVTNISASTVTIASQPGTTSCGNAWLTAALSSFSLNGGSSTNLNIQADATGISSNVTCNGTVTVTPSPGSALTITITFTVGSGGGGGTLSVSPSNFTLNYNTGGGFPTQNLTATINNGATFVTASSNSTWLLINNNSTINFVPGTALQVGLSSVATGLATGSYSGAIFFTDSLNNTARVDVTLVVNSGTSAGLTISPSSLAFSAQVGGSSQVNNMNVTSSTGGTFTVTSSVGTTVQWLSAFTSTSNLASNTTGVVSVTANPSNLANGTYTGTVTVSVGSQSQAILVTLTVGTGSGGGTGTSNVAPNNITLSWQSGTDPGFVNRPEISITGTSGNWSSTVSTAQGGSWLSLSPASGSSLPAQATVVVNPAGLTAGNYSGTVTITTPSGTQNVTIVLSVSAGAILNSRPGSLIFSYQTGTGTPAGQSVFFSTSDIALNSSLDITGTVAASVPWITVTTFQKSIQVFVDPTGLTGGVYSGNITVSPSNLSALTLPVVLVVNGGAGGGGSTGPLVFTPSSLGFAATAGTNPATQTLQLTASVSTSFTVTSNQSWLTVSPTSGTAPTNLSVAVAAAGLAAGTYNGTLTFNSSGVQQFVTVSLTVTGTGGGGGGASGNVTVSSSSLKFDAQAPAGTLPVQGLTVSSASGTSGVGFVLQVTTASGGAWLSTSPGPGQQLTTTQTISVNANASGLGAGTYNGNIRISPTGGTAIDVPVTLTVTSAPTVSATPTSLTFTYRAGGSTPSPQTIAVSSAGAALPFTATASSNGNWLSVSPTSGAAPANISASVNAAALSAGTYLGTITVAGATAGTGSTTINVTLNVTVPLPTITRVTNAASYAAGNIAPGEIITLFGTDIGPATLAGLALDNTGKVATTLAGVQVTVKGYPAPLIYVSNTQIAAVAPYEVAQFTSADVLVKYLGQSSNGIAVNVSTTAPGVFTANASGTGPGAILNQNGSPNGPNNPATRGDTIVVYLTGEGQTSPAGVTGKVTTVSSTPPLTPAPLLPISVLIGGQPANFSFAGEAPGFVSGVMQLNVTVPLSAGTGAQPIVVSIGGNSSQSGVTVALQ